MDKGYFPQYKAQMSRMLCDDLYTFRTELKKVIIPITKSAYDIFPKGTVTRKEDIQKHVIAAATELLKTSDYLRIPDSSNGEWKNFVSQALMDGCLAFYYSSSKKALKNTDEFRHTIPQNGLILIATVMKGVLSGFSETGTDKLPDLSADKCRSDFNLLRRSVDKLMDIPERHEELEDMLAQWAMIGMACMMCFICKICLICTDCKEGTSLLITTIDNLGLQSSRTATRTQSRLSITSIHKRTQTHSTFYNNFIDINGSARQILRLAQEGCESSAHQRKTWRDPLKGSGELKGSRESRELLKSKEEGKGPFRQLGDPGGDVT
ncbi:uncharacterized protein HD556DRAFT_1314701 [Suillus plorans]|uniref:DUF6532 domain-containing protein n=1 Tax=Suillus plorans TaxID=116603 RepID=A0A9P7DAQ9_9AGAM|nr:uncharacterized protein HD556DRAFT_1314701 [Suillus plorans]KAG1784906.1 hypothetical protein HD556DRAFT_1314701 [Suillus plorans]